MVLGCPDDVAGRIGVCAGGGSGFEGAGGCTTTFTSSALLIQRMRGPVTSVRIALARFRFSSSVAK